jgi:hypothetical protein
MGFKFVLPFLLVTAMSLGVGCSGIMDDRGPTDDKSGGGNVREFQRLNWQSVPAEYNPRIDDLQFTTPEITRINLDLFSFDGDVEFFYSPDIPVGQGLLRMYKVFKGSASWGTLQPTVAGKTLNIINYGRYSCSLKTNNGQITDLNGGCYVRLQIFLPVGTLIEVYNVGRLINQRLNP